MNATVGIDRSGMWEGAPQCLDLIVAGKIHASSAPLPFGVTVSEVTLLRGNVPIWTGEVAEEELVRTPQGEIHTVARGCPPSDLGAGQVVVVIYKLTFEGAQHWLKSEPVEVIQSI